MITPFNEMFCTSKIYVIFSMMLTYNNILNDYLMTFRYFGGYYSWQKSKLTRVSNLVSTAGFIVDGYNGIKFDAKIKI